MPKSRFLVKGAELVLRDDLQKPGVVVVCVNRLNGQELWVAVTEDGLAEMRRVGLVSGRIACIIRAKRPEEKPYSLATAVAYEKRRERSSHGNRRAS